MPFVFHESRDESSFFFELLLLTENLEQGVRDLRGAMGAPSYLVGGSSYQIQGFGEQEGREDLLEILIFDLIWCLWTERNDRIFRNWSLPENLVWDKVVCFASFWIFAYKVFPGVCITENLRDWKALLYCFLVEDSLSSFSSL